MVAAPERLAGGLFGSFGSGSRFIPQGEQIAEFWPVVGALFEMGENDAAGDAADFGAGITDGMFDHAEADDDTDMRAVAVGLAPLAGTEAANLAVESQPFFPNVLFLLFESGDLFVLGHARHKPGLTIRWWGRVSQLEICTSRRRRTPAARLRIIDGILYGNPIGALVCCPPRGGQHRAALPSGRAGRAIRRRPKRKAPSSSCHPASLRRQGGAGGDCTSVRP